MFCRRCYARLDPTNPFAHCQRCKRPFDPADRQTYLLRPFPPAIRIIGYVIVIAPRQARERRKSCEAEA
jgi:hypothetical protein